MNYPAASCKAPKKLYSTYTKILALPRLAIALLLTLARKLIKFTRPFSRPFIAYKNLSTVNNDTAQTMNYLAAGCGGLSPLKY